MVVDVSDPANMIERGSLGTNDARDLCYRDGYVYVADVGGGLKVIDVSDPDALVQVGHCAELSPRGVSIRGDYIFAARSWSGGDYAGIGVVDVTVPASPTFAHNRSTCNEPWDIFLQDDYAYIVSKSDQAIQTIDISDPLSVVHRGTLTLGYEAYDVFVVGPVAHVASRSGGLTLVNVDDPVSMQVILNQGTADWAEALHVVDDYLYVCATGGGLDVYQWDCSSSASSIIITSPDEGDYWIHNPMNPSQEVDVTWTSQGVDNIDIQIGDPDGGWVDLATSVPAADGSHTVVIPAMEGDWNIRVCDAADGIPCDMVGLVTIYITGVEEEIVSARFTLLPCAPNPFNPSTTIRFGLPQADNVNLRIYDASSRVIRTLIDNRVYEAGQHEIHWDGRSNQGRVVAAGIYFCQLQSGTNQATTRMTLLK